LLGNNRANGPCGAGFFQKSKRGAPRGGGRGGGGGGGGGGGEEVVLGVGWGKSQDCVVMYRRIASKVDTRQRKERRRGGVGKGLTQAVLTT